MDKQNDTIHGALYILRYFPGIAVLSYAYFYLVGYLYLFRYFAKWGLNVHDIGFSIVDYATVALYPCYFLLVGVIGFFVIGLIIRKRPLIRPSKKEHKTLFKLINYFLKYSLVIALFIPTIYLSVKYKSLWAATIFLSWMIAYIAGILPAILKIPNKTTYFKTICLLSLAIIFALLLFAEESGNNSAEGYRKYTFSIIKEPEALTEVAILANAPLKGMELYQVGSNRYEGLYLLAFKGNIYYFVPFIGGETFKKHHELMNQHIQELQKEIADNLEEVKNLQGQTDNKQVTELLKQVANKIDDAKKGTLSVEAKRALLNEADNTLRSVNEQLKSNDKVLKEARDILDLVKEKQEVAEKAMDEIRRYAAAYSPKDRICHAIRSDEIVNLIYLNRKESAKPKTGSKPDNQKKS